MAKKPGTALINWNEELARQATIAAGMEASTASGQFISFKSGQMSYNDAPIPGNRIGAIILDAVLENVFYEGEFNPEKATGPTCFAFGRDEVDMAPHDAVGDKQNPTCRGCPMNEFGTADRGKGKACKNIRRLAVVPAGEFDQAGNFKPYSDAARIGDAPIAYIKVPVTSVKNYSAHVKSVAGVMKRPPHGIVTKIEVVPDAKSQFKVLFSPLAAVPDALMGIVMKRHEEAKSSIMFAYQTNEDDKTVAATKQGRGTPVKPKAPIMVKRGARY